MTGVDTGREGEWLTVSEASKLTGYPSRDLSSAVKANKLPARKEGRFWRIEGHALEKFLLREREKDLKGERRVMSRVSKRPQKTKKDSGIAKGAFVIVNEPIYDSKAMLETGAVVMIFCVFLLCAQILVGHPLAFGDIQSGTRSIGSEISQALMPPGVTQAAAALLSGGN